MPVIIREIEKPKSCGGGGYNPGDRCPFLDGYDCYLQKCNPDWNWDDLYQHCPLEDYTPTKTGEWLDAGLYAIGTMGAEYRNQKCSICGYTFVKAPAECFPNFCRCCGTDMRKKNLEKKREK